MNFLEIYSFGLLLVLILMIAGWIISLLLKDSSIVDIFWGTGFVILCWAYFFMGPDLNIFRKFLISILVSIWGLRLSLHIGIRNLGKGEDFRYQKFRRDAGRGWWWQSLFRVFILQGILLWIISAPLLAANLGNDTNGLTAIDYIAVFIWLIGFSFEALGDLQLTKFKANPANRGKVLRKGLWRYTRHPNYFGDSVQWWGYYLIAIAAGGWWTVFSPVFMTLLLLRISGVALLEKTLTDTKPEYQKYKETTSGFFPWFPKKLS